jgi:hypothetical protein
LQHWPPQQKQHQQPKPKKVIAKMASDIVKASRTGPDEFFFHNSDGPMLHKKFNPQKTSYC